jgi:hypothetical protein
VIDQDAVRARLAAADNAPSTDAKGKAYEELAEYLFAAIPGCIVERNITNVFHTEQIDLAVGNAAIPNGLPLLESVLLVECKDWSRPVDSSTVGYFLNICAGRNVRFGVLVAANGITGDPSEISNAHALGMNAASRGVTVIVITSADIASLASTEQFVELLNRRYLRAVATGGIGFPD